MKKEVMDGKSETLFRILKEEWIEEETEWIFLRVGSAGGGIIEKVDAKLIFFDIIILKKFSWKEVVLCQQ